MFKKRMIKWNFLVIILCLVFISPIAANALTPSAADEQELRDELAYFSNDFPAYLADPANRAYLQSEIEYWFSEYLSSAQISTFIDFLAVGDTDGGVDYLISLFGASPTSMSSPVSAGHKAGEVVMRDLVLPAVKTKTEEKKEAEVRGKYPRMVAGYLRYENVSFGSQDTDIIGISIGLAWDVENISYGFVIPYDYLDAGGSETHRIGTIGFIQYNTTVIEDFSLGLTANLTYMRLDFEGGDINVWGGGPSISLTYEAGDVFVPSLAVSYQYSVDDTGSSGDYQHLVKTGLNFGFRVGEDAVINLFGIWNRDVSSYMEDGNNSFGDVGVEAHYNMSETFSLSGGYKTVVGFEDYDSHTIYLGALLRF